MTKLEFVQGRAMARAIRNRLRDARERIEASERITRAAMGELSAAHMYAETLVWMLRKEI